MNPNHFIRELISLNPELVHFYNSEQYKLSLKIIDKMMKLSFNSRQMASLLNISHDLYLRLESGDSGIDIGEYNEILAKLSKINS